MSETEIKKVPKCIRGKEGQATVITNADLLALYNENFELVEEEAKTKVDAEVKAWALSRAKEMDWITVGFSDAGMTLSSTKQADTTKTGHRNSTGSSTKADAMNRMSAADARQFG